MSILAREYTGLGIHFNKEEDSVKDGILTVSQEEYDRLKYPQFAPSWDPRQSLKFKNPEPFVYEDRGLYADPTFSSLLTENVKVKPITPKLGLEVKGIQLSQLSPQQKDDLALLVEQRGVVAFRDQDFKDLSFDKLKNWGEYYGPLHVHPTSGAPIGQPEFHIVYRRGNKDEQKHLFARHTNLIGWHSDVSYENQPPGITVLCMLQTGSGGDTQFVDAIEAYDRLSDTMKKFLDGLQAVHTSKEQINDAIAGGGIARKLGIDSIHPIVRWHPVLKKKSLFINSNFTTRILGLKEEESNAILEFLLNHLNTCLDAHIRANWDERTVVVWDNRRLIHTATFDWDSAALRHCFRITTLAERPVGSEEEYKKWTPQGEKKFIKNTEDYINLVPSEFSKKFY